MPFCPPEINLKIYNNELACLGSAEVISEKDY
jgi:hypothetical protein